MSHEDNDNIKKMINCSFCGKNRTQVDKMVEGPEFHGGTIYICNECVEVTHDILHSEDKVKIIKNKKEKIPTPEQIKTHLDQYIVGQNDAKKAISVAVYNHYKRIHSQNKNIELEKSNLLMIGSSGCGKTLTAKTIAKLFDIPYIIADATSLTEAGYVGEDAINLVKRLLKAADNDIEKAQRGIIFIDEIDKKSKRSESAGNSKDISGEGVQQALLKLIEGSIIKIEEEYEESVDFDTKDVLFIFSGAFVGLDEIIKKNRSKASIGIGATLVKNEPFANLAKTVNADDLIKFGLIPEFVGRCPITVVFDDLDVDMLVKILKEPKNNIIDQYKTLFKYEGISLEFDDKYLYNVAEESLKQKIGARGLRSIIEKDLQETQFILPRLAKDGVRKISVDSNRNIKHFYKKKRASNEQQI